ncbi:MAG: hypothetical protein ACT4QE_01365 [Anaerolineales bacterium]
MGLIIVLGCVPIVLLLLGICIVAPAIRQHPVRLIIGLIVFLLGFASSAFLYSQYSPLDWIIPNYSKRVVDEVSDLRIEFVQAPDNDFYFEYIAITKPDGSQRRFSVAVDNTKCWTLQSYFENAKIYYRCNGQTRVNLYYDIDRRILYTPDECQSGCEIDRFMFSK